MIDDISSRPDLLDAVARSGELGLQLAMYRGDELLLDVCWGTADAETSVPVTAETLFPIFSVTKAVTATAVHLLVDRRLLDYDTAIASLWPEFGVHGKASVTVGDALVHRAGIPQMPDECTVARMCDWEWMVDAVADLEPLWAPGTATGYHAYTYGWILGEVVRRVDPASRPFGTFIQQEIVDPLGLSGLWIGTPGSEHARIARLQDLPPGERGALITRAIPDQLMTSQSVFGKPEVRSACHPAAGGIANARSLARLFSMLASGGRAGGRDLLSAATVERATSLVTDDVDVVMGRQVRKALGYWLGGELPPGPMAATGDDRTSFGHPGAGGAVAWAEPSTGTGFSILKNRMLPPGDAATDPLVAVGAALSAIAAEGNTT